jgi:hypothetical protein
VSTVAPGAGAAARRYSCAAVSQSHDEPVLGTASGAPGFLLVEEPGPWGLGAVPASRLGQEATAALRAAAAARSEKLLLVRRPETRGRPGAPGRRTLFRAWCERGEERVLTRTCDADAVPAAVADEAGWEPYDGPLLLVCTHGRKDWCCALRGRPLAQAVAAHEPEGTWECSHLGGCRFAANLLALPTGHVYGRVDAADAGELVAAVRAGSVLPRALRGRSTDAMVVQAADVHARLELGRDRADDLVPVRAEPLAADERGGVERWRITLAGPAAGLAAGLAGGRTGAAEPRAAAAPAPRSAAAVPSRVAVELRLGHVQQPQRLTCGAEQEQYARTWEMTDLRELPGA